jgi:hypothetical protein
VIPAAGSFGARAAAARNVRRWIPFALAATGALAAGLSALFQWPGLALSPDGWAYWEGSVSWLHGDGYRYLGGQPITLWPPLFSLWLAAWQATLGPLAGTVAIAQAVAIGGAGVIWARLALVEGGLGGAGFLALPALAGLLAFSQRELGAESLYMALLGLALSTASRPAIRSPDSGVELSTPSWIGLALLLAALLLTRNSALAVLPGVLLVARASDGDVRGHPTLRALAAGAGAVALWVAGRAALGQTGSHPLVVPAPSRFFDVARGELAQLVEVAGPRTLSLGAILLLAHLALGAGLVRWIARGGADGRGVVAARLLLFAVVSLAGFVLLVPIASPLETRFGRFALCVAPLFAVVPALVARSRAPRALRALAWMLLLATLGVQARRATFWISSSLRDPMPGGLAWASCLDPRGAAVGCVTPPDFAWIDRHYRERGAAPGERR